VKWVVLAVVVALVLDRLLLRAERRGWIYYRKRKPTSGAASAAAFGPMAELFQPGRQVVVEERQRQENARRSTDDGAPPQL
jgi:hypothetical protein